MRVHADANVCIACARLMCIHVTWLRLNPVSAASCSWLTTRALFGSRSPRAFTPLTLLTHLPYCTRPMAALVCASLPTTFHGSDEERRSASAYVNYDPRARGQEASLLIISMQPFRFSKSRIIQKRWYTDLSVELLALFLVFSSHCRKKKRKDERCKKFS